MTVQAAEPVVKSLALGPSGARVRGCRFPGMSELQEYIRQVEAVKADAP